MERRGSGLVRIMEAYKNNTVQPSFYSNKSSFNVVFPKINKMKNLKNNNEKYTITDNDLFIIKMHKYLPKNIQNNTMNQINIIYNIYGFDVPFKREEIEKALDIKRSRALDIIKLLEKSSLIEKMDSKNYKFKK